ncbi:Ig-like domain-containing protein [Labilibaculum sp.]|uniref:Ig-like domain-containing protein n=1 Tax=Labilibaculum sp. TaxID=2060723 RepID=UPI00356945A6
MKKLALNILLGIATLTFIYSCARQGTPNGGPIDRVAPKVINTLPKNYSTNYKGGKIEVFFNEFVKLNDISNNFIISPPLKKKPSVKLKGRSIYIKLEEQLRENTTYTLDFGDGLSDNNEGNVLEGFQFVFSTGDQLDSLSIKGKIDNAFTEKPVEDVMIMAYLNTKDSIPYQEIASYIAKPDSSGYFQLNNLSKGDYKIFALVDGNQNYLYNGPGEMIGFKKDLVTPSIHTYEQIDSISKDSIVIRKIHSPEPTNVHIRMFDEINPLQYLTTYKRDRREMIYFEFNTSRKDSLKIDFLGMDENPNWYLLEKNRTNDTLSYWITDSLIYKKDTLLAKLQYLKSDSLGQLVGFIDTVKLRYSDPTKAKESKKKKKQITIKAPTYNFKLNASGAQDLNRYAKIVFNEPLAEINKDSIQIYRLQDTLEIPIDYKIEQDPTNILTYNLKIDWKPETQYKVEFDSTAFRNIYGIYSDKYKGKITTQEEDYYGRILLSVGNVKTPLLVQLLKNSKSETLLQTKKVDSDQVVVFDYLAPDSYFFKIIIDENRNGKWDTGNYLEGIQPELVIYYKKELKVRSNWDVESQVSISEEGKEINFNKYQIELELKKKELLEKALQKEAEGNKRTKRSDDK